MAETVNFFIKISDNGTFKKVEVDASSLRNAVRHVKDETDRLSSSVINWSQASQAIDQMQQAIGQLVSVTGNLASVYQTQLVAETQLQTIMSQRMKATQDEIQSIKALCAAQQQLGIIGDEVQLSGAQQMATFLNEKASLDALIPAMNNLLAQQNGLNATTQDAVSIGNMMGKAMQGSVDVLQRVGITFSEAQKEILKYGSESERAAVLAEVIRDNVGEMNAALAATDAGKQKQLDNTLGDIKEKLGSMVQGAMPFVTLTSEIVITTAGAARLLTTFKALSGVMHLNAIKSIALAANQRMVAVAQNLLSTSGYTAAAGTTALTVAVTALYAALTMGISAIVTGLVALFSSMGDKAKEAAESVDILKESGESLTHAVSSAKAELDLEVIALSNLIKTNSDASSKVDELNNKYGAAFGYHKTAAEWYKMLIEHSKLYCTQLGYEAQAKVLAAQIAALELEKSEKEQRRAELNQDSFNKDGRIQKKYSFTVEGKKEFKELDTEIPLIDGKLSKLNSAFQVCTTKMSEAQNAMSKLSSSTSGKDKNLDILSMSYTKLSNAINENVTKLGNLDPNDVAEAERLKNINKQLSERKTLLGQLLGIEKAKSKTQETVSDPRPENLDTLKNIDAEIAYQQKLRSNASQENILNIDNEIKRLKDLKEAFIDASHVPLAIDQIKTYEELDNELAYYEHKLRTTTSTERVEIQSQINKLNELRDTWNETSNNLQAPASIDKLNTINQLDDAINYYSTLQKKASSDEIINLQRQIDLLNEKKESINRLTSIPSMQGEIESLSKLEGKQLSLELQLIGFEGIQGKIKQLQRMLNDTKNPLNDEQRKEVIQLTNSWTDYSKQLQKNQLSLSGTWSSIKMIGGSIENITSSLKGNGNAWQKISGIIDGVLGLYEGFKTVTEIIDILTAYTTAHAAAKSAEAIAETTEAGTSAASSTAAVTASTATASILGTETSAWSALAAAKTFAAHAYIPFAGTGIAAGFIATQEAIIAAAAIPKFANGGIAYGPTLGIFGEYAGATNNPEVVAPLDRLKSLIGVNENSLSGDVTFRVHGSDLIGVLNNYSSKKSKLR